MRRPYFSIITRTMPGREQLFERCRKSVAEQTFTDWEHVILRDAVGVGVSQAQLLMHDSHPRGEYVFVLDDDDYLSANDVLEQLRTELGVSKPAFAVVKVKHGIFGEMPYVWGETPKEGDITVSNIVVEHVQWFIHRAEFEPKYSGDYSWIRSLFAAHAPAWIGVNLVTVEHMRNGQPA